MTFEEIYIPNKEEVKVRLMELFGRDVSEAECFFSTRNYALVLSSGCYPASIRLSVDTAKTRKDVMSELMWVDDLRLTIPTVAQAVPSKNHQMAEEFTIGENHYCATMFRKANGARLDPGQWDAAYFYQAGRLLGRIHRASKSAGEEGFVYKRRRWDEMPLWDFEQYPYLDQETKERGRELFEKLRTLPELPGCFGMIHGDFQPTNLFSDWDDLWVFDFDDCCYGPYIYDIAGFFYIVMIEPRYRPMDPRDEVIWGSGGALELFRSGYESVFTLPKDQWELLNEWIRLRTAAAMGLVCRSTIRPEPQIRYILDSQVPLLAQGELPDILAGWLKEKVSTGGKEAAAELFSLKNRMAGNQSDKKSE